MHNAELLARNGMLANADLSMNSYWFHFPEHSPLPDLVETSDSPWDAVGELFRVVSAIAAGDEPLVHSSAKVSSSAVVEGGAVIGKDVEVGAGAIISGPAFICDGSVIEPGAYIHGGTAIGAGCHVGHGAEVKCSMLFDNAFVGGFSYVASSVVGYGAIVGQGVMCSDKRFDGEEVQVEGPVGADGKNMTLPSGLSSFGAVVGDGAAIGSGCVLQPGSSIGEGSRVFPGIVICGFVPDNREVKAPQPVVTLPRGMTPRPVIKISPGGPPLARRHSRR